MFIGENHDEPLDFSHFCRENHPEAAKIMMNHWIYQGYPATQPRHMCVELGCLIRIDRVDDFLGDLCGRTWGGSPN